MPRKCEWWLTMAAALAAVTAIAVGLVWGGDELAVTPPGQPAVPPVADHAALGEPDADEPIKINPDAVRVGGVAGRERLTFRERRALGLVPSKIRPIIEDLRARGEITEETSPAVVSAMVGSKLLDDHGENYSQLNANFDWDSLLEFLERLVELIMRMIGLFSYNTPAGLDLYAVHAPPASWSMAV